MTSIDNISTLITLICGLMLTDLFASMHRLIRNRRRVQWHWLPLLVSWYVLMIILKNWWGMVFQESDGAWASGWMFFYYGHLLLLFYLVVSAVLPDEIPADGLNLREFYIENRRHFWGLLACVNLLLLIFPLFHLVFTEDPFSWLSTLPNTIMLAVNISLAWVRHIRYHAVVVVLLVALVLLEVFQKFQ